MRAAPPAWYVVRYKLDPPVAVPFSSAAAVNRFCGVLRSRGDSSFVTLPLCAVEPASIRLLETIVAGSLSAKRSALVALNRIRLETTPFSWSFWACRLCEGDMSRQTTCGCCGVPNCAVRCGCCCPSEFARCLNCGENDCVCPTGTAADQATEADRQGCPRCDREPSGHCPQCDADDSVECDCCGKLALRCRCDR